MEVAVVWVYPLAHYRYFVHRESDPRGLVGAESREREILLARWSLSRCYERLSCLTSATSVQPLTDALSASLWAGMSQAL